MPNGIKVKLAPFITPIFLVICLSLIRWQFGVLLFHTIAELFSVMVGILMLVIVWNTQRFTHNDFLVYLGIGYFWIALLDTWHTFTVKGIPFFHVNDSEVTLHFWIYARTIEALLLLSATLFLTKKLNPRFAFVAGGLLSAVVVWASFSLTYPVMLTHEGLTSFKIGAEFLVIGILLATMFIYISKRQLLAPKVLIYLLASLTLTVFAELFFTLYTDFNGIPFVIGHLFKFLSFWMIYQAIVHTTLTEPFSVMAQALNSYDAIPHPAIVTDNHGLISQVNNAAKNMVGKSTQKLFQTPIHRYFHPSNSTEDTCELCHIIKNGATLNARTVFFPDIKKWFIVSIAAIKSGNTIDGMVQSLTDVTERKKSEIDFRESEAHLKTLIQTLPDLIWLKNSDGIYLGCNERFERLYGAKENEIIGKTDYDFVEKDLADSIRKHDKDTMTASEPTVYEHELIFSSDGHKERVETIKTSMFSPNGELIGVLGIARDITDRRQTEKSLIRAQKMDAIGQLTGGIAHDFNNILGIVLGNLDLLELEVQAFHNSEVINRISKIKKGGLRAADLTKQLLSFSRGSSTKLSVCNINQLIIQMNNLISRSLTPEVEVVSNFTENLWLTKIDKGGFEDSLLNIVLNARDAMDYRGHLTITTKNMTFDANYSKRHPEINPGDYIELSIEDTGEGMSLYQQTHIFEPFYTTKEQGKGTGLGLSMVFGFVKRSAGHIQCFSEPGKGTTFKIYLPRVFEILKAADQNLQQAKVILNGSETILAVDDEPELLDIAKVSLETRGYKVLTASNARDALKIINEEKNISLLFSDVVMPGGINGYELAEKASGINPEIKVLLASGYTEKTSTNSDNSHANARLLNKPYRQLALHQIIRSLLDDN